MTAAILSGPTICLCQNLKYFLAIFPLCHTCHQRCAPSRQNCERRQVCGRLDWSLHALLCHACYELFGGCKESCMRLAHLVRGHTSGTVCSLISSGTDLIIACRNTQMHNTSALRSHWGEILTF